MGLCPLFLFGGSPVRPDTAVERIRSLAEPVARTYGLEIFDVQLRRESIGLVLRVTLDRPPAAPGAEPLPDAEWVSVEDCQRVSRDLSAVLDVEDLFDRAYTLEVSSPGLDRPLRGPGDYVRFTGRLAKIVTKEPVDGQKHFLGRLLGLDGEHVVIEGTKDRQVRIAMAIIAKARLEVEF